MNEFILLDSLQIDDYIDLIYNQDENYIHIDRSKNNILNKMKYLDASFKVSFIYKSDEIPISIFLSALRGERAYLININVKKGFRNKGIGGKLLIHGFDLLKNTGCRNITLEVLKENIEAINFYKKNGFIINSEVNNFRNETNSFIRKENDKFKIIKSNKFTFLSLSKIFSRSKKTWNREPRTISLILDLNSSTELYKLSENNQIVGPLIASDTCR